MNRSRRATAALHVVATPIGNLKDISERALDTLGDVDMILCEDTRVTRKLLDRYEIDTEVMSYHQHSDEKKVDEILSLLQSGKELALVSDAGTPAISDPGGKLVEAVKQAGIPVAVLAVPGPSAVISALSISGFPADKFLFLGFPPHKKGREKFFKEVAASGHTVAFYESCHRIKKAIAQLADLLDSERELVICRELTKRFESTYRGTIAEVAEMEIPEKGEFVVVVRR